jgi:hypothetical protein
MLFQNLNENLLTHAENIELSRLAQILALGGDLSALSRVQRQRFTFLVQKARGGQDITSQIMPAAFANNEK